ncbi:ABC transporter permease [Nocardia africana]|uniref:ABC transporter permease n=1 Tax=Nocardia africana TaxID=134964 RepID=A0ABW6NTV5_9NOCA
MTAGLSVPGWGGVAMSLALVAVAAAIAYRQQLHLTRELLVAAARAGIQLVAVGAILLVLFRHTGLPGALGWVLLMVVVAGKVAARRGAGLPHAARAATIGVATGSGITPTSDRHRHGGDMRTTDDVSPPASVRPHIPAPYARWKRARKDTVIVGAMETVEPDLDTTNPGRMDSALPQRLPPGSRNDDAPVVSPVTVCPPSAPGCQVSAGR